MEMQPTVSPQDRKRLVLAHVGGLPLEELVPSAAGVGAGLALARAWLIVRLRRTTGLKEEGTK
jgi:hypothetical protein